MSKRALGRGLSSLLDDISQEVSIPQQGDQQADGGVKNVAIDQIMASADQPRKTFDDDELNELAASIREKGVLQPLLVRPAPSIDDMYEIVAGERRWRAAQIARLHYVPVIVRDFDDADALEVAMIENIQRANLNAMEEALGYRQLIERYSYTQETLASKLGKSRSHVANMVRLLNLPEEVQEFVRGGQLSASHARTLVTAPDPVAMARAMVNDGLSVRDAERSVRDKKKPPVGAPFRKNDPDTAALEAELSAVLKMRVTIRQRGERGGEISIAYRSLDDLEELRAILLGEEASVFATG